MRAYTVATVAVTLRVPAKWVDNVLSHHKVAGVTRARQGIARRLTPGSILVLEIALRLSRSLGIPIGRALELASALAAKGDAASGIDLEGAGELTLDVTAVHNEVMRRLADAVEIAPVPRRGRPPR